MARGKPGDKVACRSCMTPVVWTRTEHGKPMLCDVDPKPDGKFFLFRRNDRIEALSVRSKHESAEAARKRGDKKYHSHFATCPNADQHRRPASGVG